MKSLDPQSLVSTRMREVVRVSGLKAHVLGQLAGVAKSTVGLIESGRRPDPAGTTLHAIGSVLGVPVDFFVNPTAEPLDAEAVKTKAAEALAARKSKAADSPALAATGTEG